jgi:hypothetical protein
MGMGLAALTDEWSRRAGVASLSRPAALGGGGGSGGLSRPGGMQVRPNPNVVRVAPGV